MALDYQVTIEGMSCGMCEAMITKELKALGKLEEIKVSQPSGYATFSLQTGKEVQDSEIVDAVAKAGYTVKKIQKK